MMRSSRKHRFSSESGQAAVLIAVLCGVMIVIIAATSNLGKVVTEKMALQNAVDLAAYSGAASQAGHLNKMRKINETAWKTVYDLRELMELDQIPLVFHAAQYDGPTCAAQAAAKVNGLQALQFPDPLIDATDAIMQGYKVAIMGENMAGYAAGEAAARQAANENYPGTGAHLTPIHNMSGGGMMQLADEKIEISYHGWCIQIPPGTPVRATWVRTKTVTSWQFKNDKGIVMYAAHISATPDSPFMDLTNYFKPDDCQYGMQGGRCTMDVYSVAEVYHGKLGSILNGKGSRDEERRSVWDESHGMPSTQRDGKDLLEPHEVVGKEYEDYKVRFIGIFENQALLIGDGNTVASKISGYGNKIEH